MASSKVVVVLDREDGETKIRVQRNEGYWPDENYVPTAEQPARFDQISAVIGDDFKDQLQQAGGEGNG